MTDPDDVPPDLRCRHLILCRMIWFDPDEPGAGCSLGHLVVHVRPDANGYGFTVPRLFLFAQLFGRPDEYVVRVSMVRVETNDDGEEALAPVAEFGPWEVFVSGDALVESMGFRLIRVPFPEPGLYEFHLSVDGIEGPLAVERVYAEE